MVGTSHCGHGGSGALSHVCGCRGRFGGVVLGVCGAWAVTRPCFWLLFGCGVGVDRAGRFERHSRNRRYLFSGLSASHSQPVHRYIHTCSEKTTVTRVADLDTQHSSVYPSFSSQLSLTLRLESILTSILTSIPPIAPLSSRPLSINTQKRNVQASTCRTDRLSHAPSTYSSSSAPNFGAQ